MYTIVSARFIQHFIEIQFFNSGLGGLTVSTVKWAIERQIEIGCGKLGVTCVLSVTVSLL